MKNNDSDNVFFETRRKDWNLIFEESFILFLCMICPSRAEICYVSNIFSPFFIKKSDLLIIFATKIK